MISANEGSGRKAKEANGSGADGEEERENYESELCSGSHQSQSRRTFQGSELQYSIRMNYVHQALFGGVQVSWTLTPPPRTSASGLDSSTFSGAMRHAAKRKAQCRRNTLLSKCHAITHGSNASNIVPNQPDLLGKDPASSSAF
jgi:hypothetical protein